jgi:hypothetical protein
MDKQAGRQLTILSKRAKSCIFHLGLHLNKKDNHFYDNFDYNITKESELPKLMQVSNTKVN